MKARMAMVTERCFSSKRDWMRFEFEIGTLNHCWTKEDIAVKSISFGTTSREKLAGFVNPWSVLTKPVYYSWIELLYKMCFVEDKKLLETREGTAQDPGPGRQCECCCILKLIFWQAKSKFFFFFFLETWWIIKIVVRCIWRCKKFKFCRWEISSLLVTWRVWW